MPAPRPVTLPGADEVAIDPAIDEAFGAIAVRAGRLTYSIALPSGDQAEAQLTALAAVVPARALAYR